MGLKFVGASGEVMQADRGIGAQWMFDLCGSNVPKGCIPEE